MIYGPCRCCRRAIAWAMAGEELGDTIACRRMHLVEWDATCFPRLMKGILDRFVCWMAILSGSFTLSVSIVVRQCNLKAKPF
jgi:hypothetical protein